MATPVLATKLYIPPPRPKAVNRPRLIEGLNEGFHPGRKLTLVSAPAGFGKTTLLSGWIATCGRPVAWLSLDEGDNDPSSFLTYLIAALQMIAANVGKGVLGLLQSPQPPSIDALLGALVNEIAEIPHDFVLILDDYHLIDSRPVDHILGFLLEHLPLQMHLVIATREDPQLPLPRYRVRDQLIELRAGDLRFTPSEAAEFLNQGMGLSLSDNIIADLESRTEGWIAGLQLAALSIQGHEDAAGFIRSFTGSHRFVLDYLVEEVLQRQSESVQTFLLRTSILGRLCAPLCDAVCNCETDVERRNADFAPGGAAGQATLEYLEHANLFLIPLDNDRRWYRYHHLFADLLRQRLLQQNPEGVAEYHLRASQWFEDHGLEIEAFQHAAAANDIERASRLLQGKGMALHLRGGLVPALRWLESLSTPVMDQKPMLWIMYAGALTTAGQTSGVEQILQAAENALQNAGLDAEKRDLLGRIANNRATLAVTQYKVDEAIEQARRALEYLRPENLPVRAITTWVLGVAYQFKGDRVAAGRTYAEALSISQAIGHTFVAKLATIGLSNMEEFDNKLHQAVETYRHALQLFGDQPLPIACEAHLGLARIFYEWNDLDAAESHGQESLRLARQFAEIIDRSIVCEVFLAQLMLAKGNVTGAAAMLTQADQELRQHKFVYRIPEVAAAQVLLLLHQGNLPEAAALAQTQNLPASSARVLLAQGKPAAALAALEPVRLEYEAKGWVDAQLKIGILQAMAYDALGDKERAIRVLGEVLAVAEPGGFIRSFLDEGKPMADLLSVARGKSPNYVHKLLAEFEKEGALSPAVNLTGPGKSEEPGGSLARSATGLLSDRELDVLRLIAQGLTNREISQKLFLALDTIKGHNRVIFEKLQVQNRTEAVARARELGLL